MFLRSQANRGTTRKVSPPTKNVMVEMRGPNGWVLNSHLSDQSGQISALNIGARICILAVFGTHVEDYWCQWGDICRIWSIGFTVGHQLHGPFPTQDHPSWIGQQRCRRWSNVLLSCFWISKVVWTGIRGIGECLLPPMSSMSYKDERLQWYNKMFANSDLG